MTKHSPSPNIGCALPPPTVRGPKTSTPLQTLPVMSRFQAHHLSRPPFTPADPFCKLLITSVGSSVDPITFTHVIQADTPHGYLLPLQPYHSSPAVQADPSSLLKLTLPRSLIISSTFTKTLPRYT